jgi:energy-coupling factor transporter ATP-binding protein EcfA2
MATMDNKWVEIYQSLNPNEPLKPGDKGLFKELYINDFSRSVKKKLLHNINSNYKLLLSGHNGCGKSTFLNILAEEQDIKDKFQLIRYSVKDILDVNDIDHIDLLLSIVVQAINSLPDGKLDKAAELKKQAEDFGKVLHGLVVTENEDVFLRQYGVDASGGIGARGGFLGFLQGGLFTKYKVEGDKRIKVREHFTKNITDFVSFINRVLLQVRSLLDKEPLILIDDTDKIPPDIGLKVFFDNGHHLAKPDIKIVFVVDVSLSTSSKYSIIQSKLGEEEFFPAIKVLEKDGKTSEATEKNVKTLKRLVWERIPKDYISDVTPDDALEYVIRLSGGVVRELIRLLNHAIFNAEGKIEKDNVSYALYKIANVYNFYGQHTKIMKETLTNPDWYTEGIKPEDEAVFLQLLHMPAIFQYRNGDMKWYRPYPIFIDWLKKLNPKPEDLDAK